MKFFEIEISEKKMKVALVLPEDESDKPNGYIEFSLSNKTFAQNLRLTIIGFKKIDEMEMSTDYDIISKDSKIKITGNLYNAFAMLSDRQILPYRSTQSLKQKAGFNKGLYLTKDVILENVRAIEGTGCSFI